MADPSPATAAKKLHGKVAIVTGGASGIGEATARRFADNGVRTVVIADVQDEKGRAVASSIGAERCSYVRCDVTDEEQVKSLVESTVAAHGRLDVMFSNAGITSLAQQTVLDMDLGGAYERLFAVNARGMAACVKHAGRAMAARGGGSIVCTASLAASMGTDRFTDYTMSKHAVLGLVRAASMQLAPRGVRVNAVSPGAVGTPLMREMLGFGDEVDLDKVVEGCSRVAGTLRGRNVADAVVFLASNESEFVTCQDLVVDGGFVAVGK